MNRSFDKILVRRIREVFDNHHEPVDQSAWKDMQRRLDAGRNLRVVYIHRASRIAAVLLVLFLVFWPFNRQIRDYLGSGEESTIQNESASTTSQTPGSITREKEVTASAIDSAQRKIQDRQEARLAARNNKTEKILPAKKEGREPLKVATGTTLKTIDYQKITPLTRKIDPARNIQPSLAGLTERWEQKSTWEDISADTEVTGRKENINLGVALSTLYNYTSKATKSDLNFSGGVLSEIDLLPNLSMQTGVIVSRQYFTTQGSSSIRGKDAVYSYLATSESHSPANVTSTSDRVKLVGLDVPVNLQYRYRDFSLTAGISSFTYIQEQYSHRYSAEYVNYVYDQANNLRETEKVIRSQSVKESYDPLQQFDLANILNLSLGYHFTFDRSQLVLEPYMKHPLGDLTSQDIRFGSRGIRLKFQF
jgi:hypothetical protein